ncbi:gamma-butyrobetaine dioxygenase-like [Petromyzon marinus]|uniref:gamma-butyrobetaine dioxygenase-like n=1 Tax=Petromyzon marinus TaxID=7757 RepID=UPI003F726128
MYSALLSCVQFLHCVRQALRGGSSQLVDGFWVCEQLRREQPAAFRLLTSTPLNFVDVGADQWDFHVHSRNPVIQLDEQGRVSRLNLNHATRDSVLDVPLSAVRPLYTALSLFTALTESPRNQITFTLRPGESHRGSPLTVSHHSPLTVSHHSPLTESPRNQITFTLRPGDVITFDNWRVLHGRADYVDPARDSRRSAAAEEEEAGTGAGPGDATDDAGDAGGRLLEGCYLDWDVVLSTLRLLRAGQEKKTRPSASAGRLPPGGGPVGTLG